MTILSGSSDPSPTAASTPETPNQRLADSKLIRLYKEHYRPLVNFLRVRRWQSLEDAKDIAQDAFIRIWPLRGSATDPVEPSHLYQIALNLATDRYRQRTGRDRLAPRILMELDSGPNDMEAHALNDLQIRELYNYLAELPESHQRAFRRWYIDGSLQREIALELGVSTRMVTNYISHATCYCRLRLNGVGANKAKKWRKT